MLTQIAIPAKAGIQGFYRQVLWIPAFAGMTVLSQHVA